jgi:hypothetical protein
MMPSYDSSSKSGGEEQQQQQQPLVIQRESGGLTVFNFNPKVISHNQQLNESGRPFGGAAVKLPVI